MFPSHDLESSEYLNDNINGKYFKSRVEKWINDYVVCVLWGDKYSDDYVRILKAMVERNTTFEHRFICFSDREVEGVDCRPLIYEDLQGWWQKIYLFKEGNKLNERVVYFDLDTVITGNIDWLMKYRGAFMGIENLGVNNHQYEDVTQYKGVLQSDRDWETQYLDQSILLVR